MKPAAEIAQDLIKAVLEEEPERLWTAPADTPGYKVGSVTSAEGRRVVVRGAHGRFGHHAEEQEVSRAR